MKIRNRYCGHTWQISMAHASCKNPAFGLAPAARTRTSTTSSRTNRTQFEASILETLTWNSRGFCKINYGTSWENDFSAFRDSFTKVKCFKIRYTCLESKAMKRKNLTTFSRIQKKKNCQIWSLRYFLYYQDILTSITQ